MDFRARADCFQYFTGISGTVTSLNYAVAMLAEVTYTICVRREAGHCGINWRAVSPTTSTPDSFDLDSVLTVSTGVSSFVEYWKKVSLNLVFSKQFATAAEDAYLSIPGSQCQRYSGIYLNSECSGTADEMDIEDGIVTATGLPFTLTSTNIAGSDDTDGFSIVYNQVRLKTKRKKKTKKQQQQKKENTKHKTQNTKHKTHNTKQKTKNPHF